MILLSLQSTSIQSIPTIDQLSTSLIEASSTMQQAQALVTPIFTIPFISIPLAFSIVTSILLISAKLVEHKLQMSTSFLWSGKGKEEEIDLDEEILIPIWDITNLTLDQMHIFGELLRKKARQQRLREERNREFKILEDAKNILSQAIGTKIDTSQPILFQLVDAMQKFNEDLDG